jgi:hypothetical protein
MRPVSSCPVLRFTAGIGESDRTGAGRFASGVLCPTKTEIGCAPIRESGYRVNGGSGLRRMAPVGYVAVGTNWS